MLYYLAPIRICEVSNFMCLCKCIWRSQNHAQKGLELVSNYCELLMSSNSEPYESQIPPFSVYDDDYCAQNQ